MSRIRLTWTNASTTILEQRVYRSISPLDIDDMPDPLAVLPRRNREYLDSTIEDGLAYYYAVSSVLPDYSELISKEIKVETAPVVSDPHWDKVVALLHFDDETDPWKDETGKLWAAIGNVEIAPGKWGSSAGSFVNSNDRYLRSPNTDGIFNLPGQFTFECWFQHSNSGSPYRNIFLGGSSSTPGGFAVTVDNKTKIDVAEMYGASILSAPFDVGDAWHHLAVTRHSDNIIRLFLNGVLLSQTISTSSFTFSTSGYAHILNHLDGSGSVGRVDELRITKGVARYTGNFTPPTEPFPNN